jgi:hypothetical protein
VGSSAVLSPPLLAPSLVPLVLSPPLASPASPPPQAALRSTTIHARERHCSVVMSLIS